MKRFLAIGTLLLLGGCGALESDYNPDNYGPMLSVSNKKLPAYELPDKFNYLGEEYTKVNVSNNIHSGNLNDQRGIIYASTSTESKVLVMDEIVGSDKQAIELLKSQAKFRGNATPEVTDSQYGKYISGIDQKLNWAYILLSTYDPQTSMSRIKIFLVNPYNPVSEKYLKLGKENIVKDLSKIGLP